MSRLPESPGNGALCFGRLGRLALLGIAALALTGAAFQLTASRAHLARIEDRGQGISQLRYTDGLLAGVSLYGRRAFLMNLKTRSLAEWSLDDPAVDGVPDPYIGALVAMPYLDNALTILGPHQSGDNRISFYSGSRGRYVIAAATRSADAWHLVFIDTMNDDPRGKPFPYMIPSQLRFRYRIARVSELKRGMASVKSAIYEGHAEWHEESFHPWIAFTSEGSLYVLNTMSEELAAHDAVTGDRRWLVPVPSGPVDMILFEGRLLIACPEAGSIFAFDAATGEPRAPIPAGRGVVGLAAGNGRVAAASKYARRVLWAEPAGAFWAVESLPFDGVPSDIVFTGSFYVVPDALDGELTVYDAQTHAVRGRATIRESLELIGAANP